VPNDPLLQLLLAIGIFFLVAGIHLLAKYLRFRRLRPTALLTWPSRYPPLFGLLFGVLLPLSLLSIVIVKLLIEQRPPLEWLGELMMLIYFGALLPLSFRIRPGFYEQGILLDDGFLPYSQIGGLSWREQGEITLLVIPRMRRLARRLVVPQRYYGEARRLLRDRIASHEIRYGGTSLDLGGHDEREDV
jgi:hypothetical protein